MYAGFPMTTSQISRFEILPSIVAESSKIAVLLAVFTPEDSLNRLSKLFHGNGIFVSSIFPPLALTILRCASPTNDCSLGSAEWSAMM